MALILHSETATCPISARCGLPIDPLAGAQKFI
jgi:hypothetical protein